MKTFLPLVLAVALIAIAAACGSSTSKVDGGTVTDITAADLQRMLEDKDFVFVNTHVPYGGEIEDTDLFIPYDEVEQRLSELPAAKDAKIVVYCRSGSMSGIAANTLVGLGYTNVSDLDGGMVAWEEAGYQLLQTQQ